jgi:hypothetical protein
VNKILYKYTSVEFEAECEEDGWSTCKNWLSVDTINCDNSVLTIDKTDFMSEHTPGCFPCSDYWFEGTSYSCSNPSNTETEVVSNNLRAVCSDGSWSCEESEAEEPTKTGEGTYDQYGDYDTCAFGLV